MTRKKSGSSPELPDPYWDAPPVPAMKPYVPHFDHPDVIWIVRDPEFPNRAFIGAQRPGGLPRRGVVEARIYLDFSPKEKVGMINPRHPILAGTMHLTNAFVKFTP